jgi:hypothetical protein
LTSHESETTDCVPDIICTGKEAICGVSGAGCACEMEMFSVAYVIGFIAKCLLNFSSRDVCKKCLISEMPSSLD